MVATILVIFHWGNFSKVACFSHMRDVSQFKGGHGPSGPMVNMPVASLVLGLRIMHAVKLIRILQNAYAVSCN